MPAETLACAWLSTPAKRMDVPLITIPFIAPVAIGMVAALSPSGLDRAAALAVSAVLLVFVFRRAAPHASGRRRIALHTRLT